MGMSSEMFWGGRQGNLAFTERLRTWAGGLPVVTGADACDHALQVVNARRLGIVTPYQPVADGQVRTYFTESGDDVVALRGLKCPTAAAHAAVQLAQGRLEVELEKAGALLALAESHLQSAPPARRRRLAVAIASLRLALARRSGQFTEVDGAGEPARNASTAANRATGLRWAASCAGSR